MIRIASWRRVAVRRLAIVGFGAFLIGGLAVGGCWLAERELRLPKGSSFLLVTLDTTRRDVVSPYGADPKITPNLQRLADAGTLFWNAYARASSTNPAHSTIMTGLTLRQHGVFNNRTPLPSNVDTLPEAFARAGFETAAFPSIPHVGERFEWRGFGHFRPARTALDAREATDRILEWLQNRDTNGPFFAWLHYWDPHRPYDPPEHVQDLFYDGDPYAGPMPLAEQPHFQARGTVERAREWLGDRRDPKWPRAMYTGEVHYMDRQFGRLIAYLDKSGLADRTAILVIADHGESLGEHGILYDHVDLYEPQVRIPFIARLPGFPEGLRPEVLVSQVDVVPTIVDLLRVSLQHELAGTSLVPWLSEETPSVPPPHRRLVYEHAHNLRVALRHDRWKLIWPTTEVHYLRSEPQLYDLMTDPGEERNLAGLRPEILEYMSGGLDPWIRLGHIDPASGAVQVAPEALEELRALGYLD